MAKKGEKISEEHKQRIRLAQIGRTHSVESKRKISAARQLQIILPFTDAHKQKIGDANRGKIRTDELKKHFSASRQNYPIERRNRMRKAALGKIKSPETIAKLRASLAKPEVKQKIRDNAIRQLKSGRKNYTNTDIEVLLQTELSRRGIQFRTQEEICGHAVDIFLPSENIIIEADGCFHHYCPQCNKNCDTPEGIKKHQADERKDTKFIQDGYEVQRFWGHEIHASVIDCIDRLCLQK